MAYIGDVAGRPAISRRRELAGASARSLLMTVVGEFVLPAGDEVWTSALVRALALHDVGEKSARQALARTAAEGWLAPRREGRRARWALTPRGRRLLTEGAARIYSFGSHHRAWDHHWLLLFVTVPDGKRELRHRLRTRLSWAGFGILSPGVWVSPDTARAAEARQILADLGLAAGAVSFTAVCPSAGARESVAGRAWDMRAVADSYRAFIDEFEPGRPDGAQATFVAQTRLVHEWRRFPFLDPQLPRELLPAGWTGTTAAALFHRRHSEWAPGAQRGWAALRATGDSQQST